MRHRLRFTGVGLAVAAVLACAPGAAFAADQKGYYDDPNKQILVSSWLPTPAPAAGSATDAEDATVFFETRSVIVTRRGQTAADDDVLTYTDIAGRFAERLGIPFDRLGPDTRFGQLMTKLQADVDSMTGRGKSLGFRQRPFARWPDYKSCLSVPAMTKNAEDDRKYLTTNSAYPSGHGGIGMVWGLVLKEMFDDPQDQARAIEAGLQFGESRVICGFHYRSDVVAGRMAGLALITRLKQDPSTSFASDLVAAKTEVAALRASLQPQQPARRSKRR